jgi:hypothetical protein
MPRVIKNTSFSVPMLMAGEGEWWADGYPFDLNMVTQNYPDTDGDGDIWNDFRATMQGAHVTLEVDHSATGNVFITATAVGTNGTTLVLTYNKRFRLQLTSRPF